MIYLITSVLVFISINIYHVFVFKKIRFREGLFISIALAFWIVCIPTLDWSLSSTLLDNIFLFLRSILISFIYIVNLFVYSLDFDKVASTFNGWNIEAPMLFWVAFLYLIASLLTFSFIIQFLGDYYTSFKLKYGRKKVTHIFYGDEPLITHFIKEKINDQKDDRIVLLSKKQSDSNNFPSRVLPLTFKDSMDLSRIINVRNQTNFYFLDGDLQSVEMAISLIKSYGNRITNDYLFVYDPNDIVDDYLSSVTESNELRREDSALKVRLLNSERVTLYNYFYDNKGRLLDLFKKSPSFIVVGENQFAIESAKLLSWISQVFGKDSSITCLYSDEEFPKILYSEMPAMFEKESYENRVDFSFIKVTKLSKSEIYEKLEDFSSYSGIFLFMDDIQNLELAKVIKQRISNHVPIIFNLNEAFLINQYYKKFGNSIIQTTSLDFIFNMPLERKALELHQKYQDKFIEKNFYNNKYNYYSSMSRALGDYYSAEVDKENKSIQLLKNEHNRWSIYLKTEGWVYSNQRDDSCKKHNLLIPFDELSKEEQSKDRN